MTSDILDVDLLAFEQGDAQTADAVVEATMASLQTGFVYAQHDLADDELDAAYDVLQTFFSLDEETKARYVAPGAHGQTGYTGVLVETAASSDVPDWKEMLNWAAPLPAGHPLKRNYPTSYPDPVLPEGVVPGATEVLMTFHRRIFDLQRRIMRIIAVGLGCHIDFFERMLADGPTLTRAIRYPPMTQAPGVEHVWAAEHGDINLITALPRATAKGLQVKTASGWVDALPPDGHVIVNTGMMLEQLTNGVIPTGIHRVVADATEPGERYSVVQFCHPTPWTILSPLATCVTPDNPQRYEAISAGARLEQVLYEINLIEDSRRVPDAD